MMPEEGGNKKWLGRKKGSPKSLSPEVRSLIASRAISERDTTREQLAESLIAQIEAQGYIAPTFETTIKYISRARGAGDDSLDKPWSTITLGRDVRCRSNPLADWRPSSPEAVFIQALNDKRSQVV